KAGRYNLAVSWFQRAWESGDETSLLELGRAELYGIGIIRNPGRAFFKLKQLARSRSRYVPLWLRWEAMLLLGATMIEGWLVRRDYRGGMKWLRRAAAAGSSRGKTPSQSY